MNRLLALAMVSGCGDDVSVPPPDPDGSITLEPPDFTPECQLLPQTGPDVYLTAADLGPITAGTLRGWEPDGRWFFTGTRVGGVSSVNLEKRGATVIVDRDELTPGTIDDDAVFHRTSVSDGTVTYVVAKRLIDRRDDGSLRVDRAVCDGDSCRVCTARVIRATRNADEGEGDHLALAGELYGETWDAGYTFNVRVVGTLAYLIRQDGLHVIETADPAHPVELGHYRRTGDGYSNDVKLVDAGAKRFALIADTPVDIVDVTDPTNPVLAGTIAEEAHTVFVETLNGTTRAYFGNYDATCPVYDVTNPAQPQFLGQFQSTGAFVHDLSVKDNIAYLNSWDAGLEIVDFTAPASPQLVDAWRDTPTDTSHSNWTTTIGGRHLALHGEEDYGAHLDIVDLDAASPTHMQSIGSYKTRDWVSIHNIMAFGSKAYFSYYQDGIRVLDVSDPTQPRLVGYYNTWDPQGPQSTSAFFDGAVGIDVDLGRKLVFVADIAHGLMILSDTTP